VTANATRYRSRPDQGLDLLDESAMPVARLTAGDRLAILYRSDPETGQASAVEWHGIEADVVATWRKMWQSLTFGTLAGGPDVNATMRLASYRVSSLTAEDVDRVNAALSEQLAAGTLEAALRQHEIAGPEHGHHDPDRSPPLG
jgi:hypothetical protein